MNNTWIVIVVLIEIAWVWALLLHLKSEVIESTDKICWTVVLCTLNAFGLLLYLFVGPKVRGEDETEAALKKAINEGRR